MSPDYTQGEACWTMMEYQTLAVKLRSLQNVLVPEHSIVTSPVSRRSNIIGPVFLHVLRAAP